MGTTLIHWLAGNSESTSGGGWTDMLFVAGSGALMLMAVGALAALQSRGDPGVPFRGDPGVPLSGADGVPESPGQDGARGDV